MAIRVNTGSGIDPQLVDQLIALEQEPIKRVNERKQTVLDERKLFDELKGMINTLGTSLNGMRTRMDFYKLKLESTNPEIIDGTVDNKAPVGSYEVEVKQIARTDKLLTQTFVDKDETPVGFGYMTVELDDGSIFDVDVDPDASTLSDVASQINSAKAGARAVVIKTKENLEDEEEDAYRLLVISEKSGKEAKIYVDPDTTYVDFDEHVKGQNLQMLFEDVPVYNETNTVDELMPGMVLNVKKAAPDTKVILKIDYDIDKTVEVAKAFIEGYNKISEFIEKQFKFDAETGHAGVLSKDNNLRTIRRALQSSLQYSLPNGKYSNLASVGISTDPKNGALKYDESKLKQALSEDYVGVAKLFIQSEDAEGIGSRMSSAVRSLQNYQGGVLTSKDREYKRILEGFDREIENRTRFATQRAEGIKRRFAAVEQVVNGLNAQGQALQQRLGGG